MNVIPLLMKDHKMVKKMFEEFENLNGGRAAQKKLALVEQISQALTVHAQVEEEFVYPAFKENRSMKDLVCEAAEEHQVAKRLLSELEELPPDDERYDAKVKVLGEYVLHHVKEEEKEMFPQAQKRLSTKRLEALGEQVEARRSELMEEGRGGEEQNLKPRGAGMEAMATMEEEEREGEGGKEKERSRKRVGQRAA